MQIMVELHLDVYMQDFVCDPGKGTWKLYRRPSKHPG